MSGPFAAWLPLGALRERRTMAAILAVLYGALICRAAVARVTDPDVWWLAAAGRDILLRGDVPRVNGYGFTAPLHPWVMHEWLYGVVMAWGATRLGPSFFTLVAMACGTSSLAASVLLATRGARDRASVALALLTGAPIAWMLFSPRPSSAAVALALTMALVAFRPGWSILRTALVVALESLWTQTHGSFPLGLVILAAAAVEDARGRTTLRARVGGLALAGLVTFVNPYGTRLHDLVRRYLVGDDPGARAIHERIAEFQPLWRAGPIWASPPALFALGIVSSLALSALAHRRHLPRALLTLALTAMAIAQARHQPLAIVLGSALLTAEIEDLLGPASPGLAPLRPSRLLAGALIPGAVIGMILWTATRSSRTPDEQVDATLGGPWVPRLAASLPPGAHVDAPYEASALILWNEAPRGVRVFFDPRNDCYPPDVLLAAVDLETDPAADRLLVVRGADHAIVRSDSITHASLAGSPLWSQVQADGPWRLFRRSTTSLQ